MPGLRWRLLVYNMLLALVVLAGMPFFLLQAAFVRRRRTGLGQRLGFVPFAQPGGIWVHAVSVGEVRAVLPMLDLFKDGPVSDGPVCLTTTTLTGQQTALRECRSADAIFYFPLDLPWVCALALERVRPRVFVAAETEFWPNFLWACFRRGVPVAIVNGRISDRSFSRYVKYGWFFRPLMSRISLFLMQSGQDAARVIEMGAPPDRVRVTGNTKYDRRPAPALLPASVERWAGEGFLLVAGSTHAGEEETILKALAQPALANVRVAIVPRHPERFDEVGGLIRRSGFPWARFSSLQNGQVKDFGEAKILLVDAMGVLDGFYALADAAFVGGSLVPVGGHNLLEPAMHGVPVLTGPHLHNFRDMAAAFAESGACRVVEDAAGLAAAAAELAIDPDARERMGRAALGVSERAAGASAKNVGEILSLMGGAL